LPARDSDRLRESGGTAGEQDQRIAVIDGVGRLRRGNRAVAQQISGCQYSACARFMEPGRVRIARNRDVGASRVLHQGMQL
jgi:hypothetical protein